MRGLRWALVAALAGGCPIGGDGALAEETRALGEFSALEVFDGFAVEVWVEAEAAPSITVRGDENLLPRFYTEVRPGTHLSVALQPTREVRPTTRPEALLVTPRLTSVYAEDDSRVTIAGAAGDLTVKTAGSATVAVEGSLGAATATALEAGGGTWTGSAGSLTVTLTGTGAIDAGGLTVAGDAEVTISGGGTATICALGEVRGVVTRGTLRLACTPAQVTVEVGPEGAVGPA